MDQDIQEAQLQHNSEISKEIELCKKDILNLLDDGKSVLSGQLKQKYYSILENEVKRLRTEISKELEDYTNNTNIHKMYQSLNSKIKKIDKIKQSDVRWISLETTGIAALFVSPFVPLIAGFMSLSTGYKGGIGYLDALMYTASPFLVVAALALTVAGIVYLTSYYLKYSFTKEMQDYIEQPIKCMDKATNTENAEELKTKEEPVLVVGNLIDLDFNCGKMEDKVQPSAPPLSKMKTGELYPLSGLSKLGPINIE